MQFTKMHGLGNGYIFINCFVETVEDPPALAREVSRVDTGIGSDGLILLLPATVPGADVRMRIFNADGSEAEMCGNGIRCLARFAVDEGVPGAGDGHPALHVQTESGVRAVTFGAQAHDMVTVNMGAAILGPAAVTADVGRLRKESDQTWSLDGPEGPLEMTVVSVGNPHAVCFVASPIQGGVDAGAELARLDLSSLGSAVERHAAFPNRINVHFAHVVDAHSIRVRTWERGSGATQACGTGACAVAVAARATGRTDAEVTTHLPGGDLRIRWDEAVNQVFMTGPATEVCSGRLRIDSGADHPASASR